MDMTDKRNTEFELCNLSVVFIWTGMETGNVQIRENSRWHVWKHQNMTIKLSPQRLLNKKVLYSGLVELTWMHMGLKFFSRPMVGSSVLSSTTRCRKQTWTLVNLSKLPDGKQAQTWRNVNFIDQHILSASLKKGKQIIYNK